MLAQVTQGTTYTLKLPTKAPANVNTAALVVLDHCGMDLVASQNVPASVNRQEVTLTVPQATTRLIRPGNATLFIALAWEGDVEVLYDNIFVLSGTTPDVPVGPVNPPVEPTQLGTVYWGQVPEVSSRTGLDNSFAVTDRDLREDIRFTSTNGSFIAFYVPPGLTIRALLNVGVGDLNELSSYTEATVSYRGETYTRYTLGPLNPDLPFHYTIELTNG